MALSLARRRHELAVALPDNERVFPAFHLSDELRHAGQYEEALRLGREHLDTARRIGGPEHPATLTAVGSLAATHAESGDHEAALPLPLAQSARLGICDGTGTASLARCHKGDEPSGTIHLKV